MGVYSLDEIIKRWRRGDLTADQTIGQILQLVQNLSQRVGTLEKRMGRQCDTSGDLEGTSPD